MLVVVILVVLGCLGGSSKDSREGIGSFNPLFVVLDLLVPFLSSS